MAHQARRGPSRLDGDGERSGRGIEFEEAIVKAAATRLRPVLMTSLCTAFGAVPFLFATGPGSEVQRPLAIVVILACVAFASCDMMASSIAIPRSHFRVTR